MRGHKRSDQRELLVSTESSPDAQTRVRSADDAESESRSRTRQIRERDRPEPSNVWQTGAFAFLTCAIGTVIAALTLSADAALRPSDLLIASGGLLVAAALCFAAHWDVNRGRRTKQREIEELSGNG